MQLHEKYADPTEIIKYLFVRILKLDNTITQLIYIYALDTSKPIQDSEIFYDKLQATLDSVGNEDRILKFGHLNGNDAKPRIKQKLITHSSHQINTNTDLIIPGGQKSTDDFIITNGNITASWVQVDRFLTSANIGIMNKKNTACREI